MLKPSSYNLIHTLNAISSFDHGNSLADNPLKFKTTDYPKDPSLRASSARSRHDRLKTEFFPKLRRDETQHYPSDLSRNFDRISIARSDIAEKKFSSSKKKNKKIKSTSRPSEVRAIESELVESNKIRQVPQYICTGIDTSGITIYDADENPVGSIRISENSADSNKIDIKIVSSNSVSSTYTISKSSSIQDLGSIIQNFDGKSTVLNANDLSIPTSNDINLVITKESGKFVARFYTSQQSEVVSNCVISPNYKVEILPGNSSRSSTGTLSSTTIEHLTSRLTSSSQSTSRTFDFSSSSSYGLSSSTSGLSSSTFGLSSSTSGLPSSTSSSTSGLPSSTSSSTSGLPSSTSSSSSSLYYTTSSTLKVSLPDTTQPISQMSCQLSDMSKQGWAKSLSLYSSNTDDGEFIANLKYKVQGNDILLQYSQDQSGANPTQLTIPIQGNYSNSIRFANTPYSLDISKVGSSARIVFNEAGKISSGNCIIGENFVAITTSTTTPKQTTSTTTTPALTSSTTTTTTSALTSSSTSLSPSTTSTPLTNSSVVYTTKTFYSSPDFKTCQMRDNKFIISNSTGQRVETVDLTNATIDGSVLVSSLELNPFNISSLQSLQTQGKIVDYTVDGNYSNITLKSGIFLQSIKVNDEVRYSVYDIANVSRPIGSCQASINLTNVKEKASSSTNYTCQKTPSGLQIVKQNFQNEKFTNQQQIASLSIENVSSVIQANATLNNISLVFNKGNLQIKNSANGALMYEFSSGGVLTYTQSDGRVNREFFNPYVLEISGVRYKLNASNVDLNTGKISYSLVDYNNNGFSLTRSHNNGETINASAIINGNVNSECSYSQYQVKEINPASPQDYVCTTTFDSGMNKMTIYSPNQDVVGFYQIAVEKNNLLIKSSKNQTVTSYSLESFSGSQIVDRLSDDGNLFNVTLEKTPNSNQFKLSLKRGSNELVGGCSIEKNATVTPTVCSKKPNGDISISSIDGNYLVKFNSRKISDQGLPYQVFEVNTSNSNSNLTKVDSGYLEQGKLNIRNTSLSLNSSIDSESGLYKVEVVDSVGKNISGACSFQEPKLSAEYSCEFVSPRHLPNSSSAWNGKFILSRSQLRSVASVNDINFNSSGIIEFELGKDSLGNNSKIIFDISNSSRNIVKFQTANSTKVLNVNESISVQGVNYTYKVDKNNNPYIESDDQLVIKPTVTSVPSSIVSSRTNSSQIPDRFYNISISKDSQIVGNCSYDANGKIISSFVDDAGVINFEDTTITSNLGSTPSLTFSSNGHSTSQTYPITNASNLFNGLCDLVQKRDNTDDFKKAMTDIAANCSKGSLTFNAPNKDLSENDVKELCEDIQTYANGLLVNVTNTNPPKNATLGELNKLKLSIVDKLKCVQHSGDDNKKAIILAAIFGTLGFMVLASAIYCKCKAQRKRSTAILGHGRPLAWYALGDIVTARPVEPEGSLLATRTDRRIR